MCLGVLQKAYKCHGLEQHGKSVITIAKKKEALEWESMFKHKRTSNDESRWKQPSLQYPRYLCYPNHHTPRVRGIISQVPNA